jgi:hypothetical protein
MKTCMESGCIDPHFLYLFTGWTWMVSFTPGHFILGEKRPRTHWIGGWVGHSAVLDDVSIAWLELGNLGCPSCSQPVVTPLRSLSSLILWRLVI